MVRSVRGAAFVLAVMAGGAAMTEAATVHGRVTDAHVGAVLPGARVRVAGTDVATTTDRSGEYRLSAVPAGSRQLEVQFLGFETRTIELAVAAEGGDELRQDVTLALAGRSESVEVQAPILEGQAKALNKQMNAANIMNAVAADQIGAFPDSNAAEAVQRVPGISIQRDQGEGRYVLVRGTEARLNAMTIDGERIPSPEGDIRNVALDMIPSDLLEAIEVTKALTPDMDADSIGGAVNLVTKSPRSVTRSVTLGGGYNAISEGSIQNARFAFGRSLLEDRLAFSLGGSLLNTDRGSENFEAEYDDGELDSFQIRDYTINRRRSGVTGALEYRPNLASTYFLRGTYDSLRDQEYRQRQVSKVSDNELERELKDRLETQAIGALTAGGRHTWGAAWMADYQLSWARAEESEPRAYYSTFVQEDVEFAPNVSAGSIDPDNIQSNAQNENIGSYAFDDLAFDKNLTSDRDVVASFNLSRAIGSGRNTGILKLGGKYRDKSKQRDNSTTVFKSDDDLFLSDFLDSDFDAGRFLGDRYVFGPGIDSARAQEIRNGAGIESEIDPEADSSDYEAKERVTAGYGMAQIQLGPRLMLLPGVRVENTNVDYTGYQVRFDDEGDFAGTSPLTGGSSYTTVLPMAHLKYNFDDRTALRVAATRSLARPNYFDLTPYELILDEDREIARGNPNLTATTSWNFDVMFERYFDTVGLVSAGVFRKSLSNYIYNFSLEEERNGDTFDVVQPRNGEAATLLGLEVAFQKQLKSGLGFYANYTFTDSEAEFPGRDGEKATLPGQSRHVGNVALSYERKGFSGRAALNFHGKYIDQVGGESAEDVYYDDHVQLDLGVSQRVTGGMRAYVEVNNLTNEPLRYYEGVPERPLQEEYYRWWGSLGLKWTF